MFIRIGCKRAFYFFVLCVEGTFKMRRPATTLFFSSIFSILFRGNNAFVERCFVWPFTSYIGIYVGG